MRDVKKSVGLRTVTGPDRLPERSPTADVDVECPHLAAVHTVPEADATGA